MTLTSDLKERKQGSQHNRPNLNNSYKTKKNFTGFYTEVNPNNSKKYNGNILLLYKCLIFVPFYLLTSNFGLVMFKSLAIQN